MHPPPGPSSVEQLPESLRRFDRDDSSLDALTGLATRQQFERSLADYDSDHATLVLVEIDQFSQILDEFGTAVADGVVVITADRLVSECRRTDQIARIDTHSFAVLFGDIDRATGLLVAKRLLAAVAAPLASSPGPESITVTAALSHQYGLVDSDELFESAAAALKSGRKAGGGRLFVGD